MASMTFMDEMKDKASRLIPSAYTELVEETTSDSLLAPNYQNMIFLCDSANSNPENVTDVVRAVRRRIDHKSTKVQYFTIQLLEALIKNCGLPVHVEIAETKGLLRDVFVLATTRKPGATGRDGDKEAHVAALTLILNMSLWFSGHSDERVKILADLADQVRRVCGPNAFDGIEPDTTVQVRRNASLVAAQRQTAAQRRQRRQEEEYLRLQAEALSQRPMVVDAIPLIIPSEEEVSGMLDACRLLAECLNTAEAQGTPIIGDEIIGGVAAQIRRDHRGLSMILSCGAEIPNMDVLFSVTDSQTAIIQRLSDLVKKERRAAAASTATATVGGAGSDARAQNGAAQQPPRGGGGTENAAVEAHALYPQATGSASTTAATGTRTSSSAAPAPAAQGANASGTVPSDGRHKPLRIRQAEDIEDYVEMQETPKMPPATVPIPTMDDLFGGAAQAPPSSSSSAAPQPAPPTAPTSAFPAPTQSVDHRVATTAEMSHEEQQHHADPAANRAAQEHSAGTVGSINDEGEGDEFDQFLSSRLRK